MEGSRRIFAHAIMPNDSFAWRFRDDDKCRSGLESPRGMILSFILRLSLLFVSFTLFLFSRFG